MKRFSTKGDFQNGKEPLVILQSHNIYWPSGDMGCIFLNRWDIAHPVPVQCLCHNPCWCAFVLTMFEIASSIPFIIFDLPGKV